MGRCKWELIGERTSEASILTDGDRGGLDCCSSWQKRRHFHLKHLGRHAVQEEIFFAFIVMLEEPGRYVIVLHVVDGIDASVGLGWTVKNLERATITPQTVMNMMPLAYNFRWRRQRGSWQSFSFLGC